MYEKKSKTQIKTSHKYRTRHNYWVIKLVLSENVKWLSAEQKPKKGKQDINS